MEEGDRTRIFRMIAVEFSSKGIDEKATENSDFPNICRKGLKVERTTVRSPHSTVPVQV